MTASRVASLRSWLAHPCLRGILFVCGVLLLVLNVIGRTHSLRNPAIYHAHYNLFTNDIVLTEKQFYEEIQRHGESDADYMIKATDAVNQGIAHYSQNGTNVAGFYYLHPSENYLLWLSKHVSLMWKIPRGYQKQDVLWYRFADWRKSVERGVGLCGTHALVLMEVLKLNHIPAHAIDLPRHVVVEASPDQGKTWWTLDPDYGVVMPEPIQALCANPDVAAEFYKKKGFDTATLTLVKTLYTEGTPKVKHTAIEMHGRAKVYFEYASYYLIWIIPIVLMLPTLVKFASVLKHPPGRAGATRAGSQQKPNS